MRIALYVGTTLNVTDICSNTYTVMANLLDPDVIGGYKDMPEWIRCSAIGEKELSKATIYVRRDFIVRYWIT